MSGLVRTREGYMLCFVDAPWAYFASIDPTPRPDGSRTVWGDDWNDAPHDGNAGTPYDRDEYEIVKVAYDGPLEVVGGSQGGLGVGRWDYLSADDINSGAAPWLAEVKWGTREPDGRCQIGTQIPAKTALADFRSLVRAAGGNVYEARRV